MTAYYNEIDPFAAAWLRQLISAGRIAPGDVDTRSIVDVRPDDLKGYTQCHFFAGIGVWSHALRAAGWSDDRPVWTGSCPCQPFSAAGKGGGFDDERHLWPFMHYLIEQCRPDVVFGEQVASKDGLAWLDLVQADLEGARYANGAVDLCAAGVGAPHIRQRLWWFAESLEHAPRHGRQQRRSEPSWRGAPGGCAPSIVGDDDDEGLEGQRRGHQAEGGWVGEVRPIAETGQSVGLADATEFGRVGRRAGEAGIEPGSIERPARLCAAGSVEQPSGERREWREAATPGHIDDRATSVGAEGQHGGSVASASGVYQDGTGPTNGHWQDADWLFCRDGKWRPAEPRPQQMVDGTAVCLGRVRAGQIRDLEFEIAEWAIRYEADAGKALHDLRGALSENTERERTPGRLPDLHGAAFLLAFLRQLTEQGWAFSECISGESKEVSENELRVLRHLGSLARPSCERGLDGQQTGEHSDPVRVLSSILARHAQEA